MSAQQLAEVQYAPRSERAPTRQQEIRRGGGGGGGGGGGDSYDSKGIATVFRTLGRASENLFSGQSRFDLTEDAARELLTGAFEALARAAETNRLLEVAKKMEEGSTAKRSQVLEQIGRAAKFTGEQAKRIVGDIWDCLFPESP